GGGCLGAGGGQGGGRKGQRLDGLAHPFGSTGREHAPVAHGEGREQGVVFSALAQQEGRDASVDVVAEDFLHQLEAGPAFGGGLSGGGIAVQRLETALGALLEELAQALFDG